MPKDVGGRPTQLVSYATAWNTFHPTTAWMPVTQVDANLVFNLSVQARRGGLAVSPAVQLAVVRPDDPNDPQALGSTVITNGYHHSVASGSGLLLKNFMFWRHGVVFNGGAGGFGEAEVGMTTSYNETGRMLGKKTIEYQPTADGSGASHVQMFPFSRWESIVGASSVKAAFVIASSTTGSLRYRLYARYANDRNAPGVWVALGSLYTAPSGNSEKNTGSMALTPGPNALFQLAVGLDEASSVEARATVHVMAAALG